MQPSLTTLQIVILIIPFVLLASAIMAKIQPKFEDMKDWQIILLSVIASILSVMVILMRCYIGPMPF